MNNIVVVNDCAHYFEDILPCLSEQFQIKTITRSRSLLNKTFGLTHDILKTKGSYFTVNYALQDAWLVRKLKHLNLLFCHGSDVRTTMQSRVYGRIVKGNLKHADQVAYTTPDLYEYIELYAPDAEYVPVPVDSQRFTPATQHSDTVNALWFNKWYEQIPPEIITLCRKHSITLTLMHKTIPYRMMPDLLRSYQIFIDLFTIDSFSKTCIEAKSAGLATVTYKDKNNLENRFNELVSQKTRTKEGIVNRKYVIKHHERALIADKIAKLWS